MRCVLCRVELDPDATVTVEAGGLPASACPGCAAELSYAAPWRLFERGALLPPSFRSAPRTEIDGLAAPEPPSEPRARPPRPGERLHE